MRYDGPSLEEIVSLFAMTPEEQAAYFPPRIDVWVDVGINERGTTHALRVALMVLGWRAKQGEAHANAEVAELCAGLAGLSELMLESDYDFLVWHPSETNEDADPTRYNVWIVVRNLCRQISRLLNEQINLPPFHELFQFVITPLR